MLDHHPEVHDAHESDDLCFGTVDSWLVYVSRKFLSRIHCLVLGTKANDVESHWWS